jgi:hypothetical protein
VEHLKTIKIKSSKKLHNCYASENIREFLDSRRHYTTKKVDFRKNEFSFSEKRIMIKAKQNNWKIPIGSSYTRSTYVMDGDVYDLCYLEEMDKLCTKRKLYYCEC